MSTTLLRDTANIVDLLSEYTHLPEISGINVFESTTLGSLKDKRRVLLSFDFDSAKNRLPSWEAIARWAIAFDVPVNITEGTLSAEIELGDEFAVSAISLIPRRETFQLAQIIGAEYVPVDYRGTEMPADQFLKKIDDFNRGNNNDSSN